MPDQTSPEQTTTPDPAPERRAFVERLREAVDMLWDADANPDMYPDGEPNDPERDVWNGAANLATALHRYGSVVRSATWEALTGAEAELARVRPVVDAARTWCEGRAPSSAVYDAVAALDGDAAAPIPSCRGRDCGRDGCPSCDGIRAWYARLDGDAAATPQPAADADRRALDSIAELCGTRAGDHRDNVVMVVRSMLQDPAAHNARRARALAVTGRLVEVVADLIRDHEDPGTEAFGALREGREFLSQGGGTSSAPPVDVPAGLRAAAKVLDEGDVYLGVTREVKALRRLADTIEADPSDATSQAIVRALATPTTEETADVRDR